MRKKTGNKLHTWEAALLLAVAAALLWGACTLQRQDALEQKVIRLHVIANSDNEADQALKLRVRDRVLVLTEDETAPMRQYADAMLVGKGLAAVAVLITALLSVLEKNGGSRLEANLAELDALHGEYHTYEFTEN